MGTPRYMSPEQAACARQPIDHRTDIYSLGATLYELATGKPVFDAQTPQGVLTQILNSEPIAPRHILKQLPRDLETIILKCLAKEPERRYQQAKDLADDLRCFLDGRAVKARRIGLVERSVRWVKKRRASVAVAASAAAVAAGLLVAGYFGWAAYAEAQLGRLTLTTDGPAMVGEVLSGDDDPIVPGFPIPTAKPVALPAGARRLRLSTPGQLSETWDIDLERGQIREIPVKTIDRAYGPTLEIRGPNAPVLVRLNGKAHLLHRAERGWRLVNGATMSPVWKEDLKFQVKHAESPYPDNYTQGASDDLLQVGSWTQHQGTGTSPGVVRTGIDLNGDGKDDLIFASRVSPSLLAVSGGDGKALWWYRAAPDLPLGHDAEKDPLDVKSSRENAGAIRDPIIVKSDGEVFIIAVFVSYQASLRTQSGKLFLPNSNSATYYVDAVNARDGKRVWRRVLESDDNWIATTVRSFPPRPEVVRLGGQLVAVLGASRYVFGFDVKTGQDVWPTIKLRDRLIQPLQIVDAPDGQPYAVAVHGSSPQVTVQAIALPTAQSLWERTYATALNNHYGPEGPDYPLVWLADLDRNGKTQIIVPVGFDATRKTNRVLGIEVLDGKTGAIRWQRTLRRLANPHSSLPAFDAPVRLAVGPDLNGDGSAEVFIVSSGVADFSTPAEANSFLQLDALSGKDGSILWRRQRTFGTAMPSFTIPKPIQWWQPGTDGWPQLIVPVERKAGTQAVTYVFSASTGRLTHVLPEVSDVEVADLNDDGLADLYYLTATKGPRLLTVLKGMPPLNWRGPDTIEPGADFDGDGVPDLIRVRSGDSTIEAISGRDGHSIWRCQSQPPFARTLSVDVNGDGMADLVVLEKAATGKADAPLALAAFSGKDGRLLWRAPIPETETSSSSSSGSPMHSYNYPLLDHVDLDGDGRPEILLATKFAQAGLCLAALSSRDGRLLWKAPMLPCAFTGRSLIDRHLFHDLDGDGVRDVVLWAPDKVDPYGNQTGARLRAFSGRDGKPLWTADLGERYYLYPRVAIADLNGDGKPAVVLTTVANHNQPKNDCALLVLDGKSGKINWRWPGLAKESWDDICPPLLVNRDGNGKRLIALGVWNFAKDNQEYKVHLFDANGNVVPVGVPHLNPVLSPVWAALDLDGAGKETLIYRGRDGVQAFDLREKHVRWTWNSTAPSLTLGGVRHDDAGKPAELALWDLGTVHGIDAQTGAPRWRCDVPAPDPFRNREQVLFTQNAAVLPLVLSGETNHPVWSLQRAMPVDAEGRYLPDESRRFQITQGPFIDYRPLPCGRLRLPWSWTIGLLVVLAYWCARRRWRRALLFSMLAIAMAAALAVPDVAKMILDDEMPLEPDERYSWQGWYGGIWLAAALVVLVIALRTLASWAFRLVRKMLRSRWPRVTGVPE
jgi:outer membrane protein assembly factor BamB